MAISSIANLFSFFTPSKPPPPKAPTLQFPDSLSSSKPNNNDSSLSIDNHKPILPLSSCDSDVTAVVCPSLAYANTLYYKSAYNVQVIVGDNEPEEKLIGRFRREVMRAGVIQECKRRRYFENSQDEKKRRTRDAARRNRKRRGPPRNFSEDKQETTKNKRDDDGEDNWELPEGGLP
ncbi:small ribosomal subunit protein bS21c-like [Lycium ferocissimum]|uniref:small ribosomal subunit protein bS21c-like n=1 Tax=Lycium ferocissimum TaxID=112874 RepID=UPI0028168301|nr:small ribosomal subunit protein bS21c-like [Lycium ferocissimum]